MSTPWSVCGKWTFCVVQEEELSALLGPDMVENDKYLRTLGMGQAAERTVERIEADTTIAEIKASMQAYLDGINAFIATKELPFEYRLINARPEPFDMHDVYCATGFMSYSFAIHLKTEPILDWMASNMTLPSSRTCTGTKTDSNAIHWANLPATSLASPTACTTSTPCALCPNGSGPMRGCSAATARPPVKCSSATTPTSPMPRLLSGTKRTWLPRNWNTTATTLVACLSRRGHTRDHAWGITMFVNDDIDLYRETLDGNRYLHGEEWLPQGPNRNHRGGRKGARHVRGARDPPRTAHRRGSRHVVGLHPVS